MSNGFDIKKVSLRLRIFISMILLTLIASILIASISIFQYRKEAKYYHEESLERKDGSIREHINYVLNNTTYPLTSENLPLIFKDKIYELSDIHSLEINLYDLEGNLLKSSKASFAVDSVSPPIPEYVLKLVQSSMEKRYVELRSTSDNKFYTSFSEIKDDKFKPLGILNLPYIEDDGYLDSELKNFLIRLGQVYTFMLLLSVIIAYFLSSYITQSIKSISEKIIETRLNKKNKKIELNAGSEEIGLLIEAYNSMVDELEESAVKLAQGEREHAWREMAKQVAHEIKNPLTPMRLSVQSFQRKFDPNDPDVKQKLDDYTKTLLQQIDTMSSVANAFSNFASMPAQQNETLDVVKVVRLSLDIFNENYIEFLSQEQEIITKMDRTQLIRVITNLVKNAIQAIEGKDVIPEIKVYVKKSGGYVSIEISDNGKGILPEHQDKVFEPKFTTKTSGMGLGLGIIKNIVENYQGIITFDSSPGLGTTFKVVLPIKE
jgi:two-component system, NtrC family, nitrogen regulation sensor histidine kinase NtrY